MSAIHWSGQRGQQPWIPWDRRIGPSRVLRLLPIPFVRSTRESEREIESRCIHVYIYTLITKACMYVYMYDLIH
jgi:hypothetical protein